jgi:hypothetical protein
VIAVLVWLLMVCDLQEAGMSWSTTTQTVDPVPVKEKSERF